MDSVDTFPSHFISRREEIQPVVHIPKRNLSPKEEKEKLIKKIEALISKNQALSEKQSLLQGTVNILSYRSMI